MSYARVQGNTNAAFGSAVSFSVTLGAPVGSGNAVMGGFCMSATSGTTATVTDDKGNTYSVSSDIFDANNLALSCFSFRLANITNGPTVITATISAAAAPNWIMLADEFSGAGSASDGAIVGQTQASPGTGTDGITSGSLTTTVDGDLIYGITFDQSGTTLASVGTGFTSDTTYNGAISGVVSEHKTQTTHGAVAATYTQAANNQATTFVMALQPPAGGDALLGRQPLLFM